MTQYRVDHWFKSILLADEDHEFTYYETYEQAHEAALELAKKPNRWAFVQHKVGDDWVTLSRYGADAQLANLQPAFPN